MLFQSITWPENKAFFMYLFIIIIYLRASPTWMFSRSVGMGTIYPQDDEPQCDIVFVVWTVLMFHLTSCHIKCTYICHHHISPSVHWFWLLCHPCLLLILPPSPLLPHLLSLWFRGFLFLCGFLAPCLHYFFEDSLLHNRDFHILLCKSSLPLAELHLLIHLGHLTVPPAWIFALLREICQNLILIYLNLSMINVA